MSESLEPAIERIAASDVDAYLSAQDQAAALAGSDYASLGKVACQHEDPYFRWEALHVIYLVAAADHRALFERALRDDPSESVRDCAKALLFRSLVRDEVMASGKLNAAGLEAYTRSIREQTARLLFPRTHEE